MSGLPSPASERLTSAIRLLEEGSSPLCVTGLSARHRLARGELPVFDDVSFSVERGRILGITGPNGCGKSTLLRVLAGMHERASGEIAYPRAEIAQGPIAYVPQDVGRSFFGWGSLETNLLASMPEPLRRRREHRAAFRAAQQRLGIELDLRLRPQECSGGMLQQAALVGALARRPALLLGDEPFSALDIEVSRRVRRGLVRACREDDICAVLILHRPDELLRVCDEVLIVPGRPFTTGDGPHRATLHTVATDRAAEGEDDLSFAVVMRELLAAGGADGEAR